MARDLELVSPGAHATRVALGLFGALIYVFLFAPIVLLVLFSFNANRYATLPVTAWTLDWYRAAIGDYQIHDALADDPARRRRGDGDQHLRRDRRRLPAGALAAAVPQRDPDRLRAPDHDPGAADRRQPAGPLHELAAPAALARDRRHRPERLHDAVRDPPRVGTAADPGPGAGARRERSRGQRVRASPIHHPAAAAAGDRSAAPSLPSRSRSTSSSSPTS